MVKQGYSFKNISDMENRDRKTIKDWIRNIENYRAARKNPDIAHRSRFKLPVSRKIKYPELDRALRAAFDERRAVGRIVTVASLQSTVREITTEMQIEHKASRGFIKRWMRRERLTYRQRTHTAQKMPEDAPQAIAEFVVWVRAVLAKFGLTLEAVINYDETPCWFDCPQGRVRCSPFRTPLFPAQSHCFSF